MGVRGASPATPTGGPMIAKGTRMVIVSRKRSLSWIWERDSFKNCSGAGQGDQECRGVSPVPNVRQAQRPRHRSRTWELHYSDTSGIVMVQPNANPGEDENWRIVGLCMILGPPGFRYGASHLLNRRGESPPYGGLSKPVQQRWSYRNPAPSGHNRCTYLTCCQASNGTVPLCLLALGSGRLSTPIVPAVANHDSTETSSVRLNSTMTVS